MQEGRPIAFPSRTLSKSEVKYAQIEKELLAITFACDRFHFYLYAREFTVESDHKPLESLILNGRSRHHNLTQNPYRPIQTSQSQHAAVGTLGLDRQLQSKSSSCLVETLTGIFDVVGYPSIIRVDNNPFNSASFLTTPLLCRSISSNHITSPQLLPVYPTV